MSCASFFARLRRVGSVAPGGFNRQHAESSVARIYETTTAVIDLAREQHISTARAADLLAEQRIAKARTGSRIRTDHSSINILPH
jgi:glutamate dehydrogenase/leucine dehydrogenase